MLKQMPIESVLDPGLVAESTKGSILEVLAVCCHDARCTEKIFSEEKQQLIDLKISRKLFSPPTMEQCGNDGAADAEMDAVMREVEAWKELPASTIKAHIDSATNIINAFSLMHYTAPRQTASHTSHGADVESLFSLAKGLTYAKILACADAIY